MSTSRHSLSDLESSVKQSITDATSKAKDTASEIADKVEDAIDEATAGGKEMGRKLKKELGERWKTVDKAAHDNAFILAAGALGVGVLIGYLIARSDD